MKQFHGAPLFCTSQTGVAIASETEKSPAQRRLPGRHGEMPDQFTKPAQVFGILGLTYFVLCFGLSRFAFWIEKRLERKGLGSRRVEKVAA